MLHYMSLYLLSKLTKIKEEGVLVGHTSQKIWFWKGFFSACNFFVLKLLSLMENSARSTIELWQGEKNLLFLCLSSGLLELALLGIRNTWLGSYYAGSEIFWLSKLEKNRPCYSATDVIGKGNASYKRLHGVTICSYPPDISHLKSHIEKEALANALCAVYILLCHRDGSGFFLNLFG